MALGRHWEWRGFGTVSKELQDRINRLTVVSPVSEWQDVADCYLWVPGCEVNVKFRSAVTGGEILKFKRVHDRHHDIELWCEDPEEIFYFPLDEAAMAQLARELHVKLPRTGRQRIDRDAAMGILSRARPPIQVIEVHKRRRTRLWKHPEANVLIELVDITQPERISCVGFESTIAQLAGANEELLQAARTSIERALEAFEIEGAGLQPMSYFGALNIWGEGKKLTEV